MSVASSTTRIMSLLEGHFGIRGKMCLFLVEGLHDYEGFHNMVGSYF